MSRSTHAFLPRRGNRLRNDARRWRPDPTPNVARAQDALRTGDVARALRETNAALAVAPDHAPAHCLLGRIALALGQASMSLAPLERAVALDDSFEHLFAFAEGLAQAGQRDRAMGIADRAVACVPEAAGPLAGLAALLATLGKAGLALELYARVAGCGPHAAAAHHAHGTLLMSLDRPDAAVDAFTRAARAEPANAVHHIDLSGALAAIGRFEPARDAAAVAVTLDPSHPMAHGNLGHALLNLNRSADAIASYGSAVGLDPDHPSFRFGLACARLKTGDLDGGWPLYEWRWRNGLKPRHDLGRPMWDGTDLGGRTILLHGEQGLGDMLQFVRFAPMVAARGGRIVLQVPGVLARLMRGVDGVSEVITGGVTIPPVDCHCPLASLPLLLSIGLGDIPAVPYLSLDRDRSAQAGPASSGSSRERVVGLVWAGAAREGSQAAHRIDRRRSIAPETFRPLTSVGGCRFVSFQFGANEEQRSRVAPGLSDALDGVSDFADTAARLAEIDLLVSVDTSIVHLAGAMGVPVWMLSRFDGCWRWLEDRTDSPWYSSMRIFRQSAPGDWAGVIRDVADHLAKSGRHDVRRASPTIAH